MGEIDTYVGNCPHCKGLVVTSHDSIILCDCGRAFRMIVSDIEPAKTIETFEKMHERLNEVNNALKCQQLTATEKVSYYAIKNTLEWLLNFPNEGR